MVSGKAAGAIHIGNLAAYHRQGAFGAGLGRQAWPLPRMLICPTLVIHSSTCCAHHASGCASCADGALMPQGMAHLLAVTIMTHRPISSSMLCIAKYAVMHSTL